MADGGSRVPTHNIAFGFASKRAVRERPRGGGEPHGLTCAHVLDLASHAHDQASVWKTLDKLPASAFIFGGRNSRGEFSWFDCAHNTLSVRESPSVYRAQGLTEMRMGFRSGLAKGRRLGDEMMGMHLSSVCAVSRKTNALDESE